MKKVSNHILQAIHLSAGKASITELMHMKFNLQEISDCFDINKRRVYDVIKTWEAIGFATCEGKGNVYFTRAFWSYIKTGACAVDTAAVGDLTSIQREKLEKAVTRGDTAKKQKEIVALEHRMKAIIQHNTQLKREVEALRQYLGMDPKAQEADLKRTKSENNRLKRELDEANRKIEEQESMKRRRVAPSDQDFLLGDSMPPLVPLSPASMSESDDVSEIDHPLETSDVYDDDAIFPIPFDMDFSCNENLLH